MTNGLTAVAQLCAGSAKEQSTGYQASNLHSILNVYKVIVHFSPHGDRFLPMQLYASTGISYGPVYVTVVACNKHATNVSKQLHVSS